MSHDIDIETPDTEEGAEERAFRRADEFEFLGATLQPWTFARQTAAIKLGMRYGRLSPDEIESVPNPAVPAKREALESVDELKRQLAAASKKGKAKIQAALDAAIELADSFGDPPAEIQTYGDIIMDAVIVLWLCSQSETTVLRARRKPDEYERPISKWADDNLIGVGRQNTEDAIATFMQIVTDVQVSTGRPDIKGGNQDSPGN